MYKVALADGVSNIIKKLGENFDYVQWVIFDADELFSHRSKMFVASLYPRQGKEYGFCRLKENEVWISTLTIQSYNPLISKRIDLLGHTVHTDLFTNVIIDELAHIKSRADHNTAEYDRIYRRFYIACYGRLLL